MNKVIIMLAAVMSLASMGVMSAATAPGDALAYPLHSAAVTAPLAEEISVQKTDVTLSVPADNTLPWGFVTGPASDHIPDYPVIIQFYKDGEPVHMAQVETNEDGSYEYRFRVLSVDLETGEPTHVFEGDYLVSIFKVVPTSPAPAVPVAGTI